MRGQACARLFAVWVLLKDTPKWLTGRPEDVANFTTLYTPNSILCDPNPFLSVWSGRV